MNCKTCGKKCEGEYCFHHKPRKKIVSSTVFKIDKLIEDKNCAELYMNIWRKRVHKSEISGSYLGKEALRTFFHHILPKNKYTLAKFDEENIILLTPEEHEEVENNMFKFEEINKRRSYLKIKYNIDNLW